MVMHGGNLADYPQGVLDFSANINPLGLPQEVRQALVERIGECEHYPDHECRALRQAIALAEGVEARQIVCGNGAADLIFRLVAALRPQRALLLAPTFGEYRQALAQAGCHIAAYPLQADDDFRPRADLITWVQRERPELVCLCNPNNPTGQLMEAQTLQGLAEACQAVGAVLLIDECFMDFVDAPEAYSMQPYLAKWPQLFILKAFTKCYAMPGLRLGYLLSSHPRLLQQVAETGQYWSVSVPAQIAGLAALGAQDYRQRTAELIAAQRRYLTEALTRLGLRVYGSQANYIFFWSEETMLGERLLDSGILLRSCTDYAGLDAHYYRAAVRLHEENVRLVRALAAALKGAGHE